MFKSLQRRKWRTAVNREFRRWHGVDLRTIGEIIGATTLRNLLNDEYELAPRNAAIGAQNVTQMLAHVYRVDIASLAVHDLALTMVPVDEPTPHDDRPVRDPWDANARRDVARTSAPSVAEAFDRP
jgi:hypothetical protein